MKRTLKIFLLALVVAPIIQNLLLEIYIEKKPPHQKHPLVILRAQLHQKNFAHPWLR